MIDALRRHAKEPTRGRVSSLAGKRLSFTGFLERPRSEAVAAARKAGATVQSKPGQTTDQGIRVTVIGEKQFWKLETKSPVRARKATRA